MKYPCMVRKQSLNADVIVKIACDGINEDGEDLADFELATKCNINFKASSRLTADKQLISLQGKAMFVGDICPGIATIKGGTLEYLGETHDIHSGQKCLNPDGTVNYTVLELV